MKKKILINLPLLLLGGGRMIRIFYFMAVSVGGRGV